MRPPLAIPQFLLPFGLFRITRSHALGPIEIAPESRKRFAQEDVGIGVILFGEPIAIDDDGFAPGTDLGYRIVSGRKKRQIL